MDDRGQYTYAGLDAIPPNLPRVTHNDDLPEVTAKSEGQISSPLTVLLHRGYGVEEDNFLCSPCPRGIAYYRAGCWRCHRWDSREKSNSTKTASASASSSPTTSAPASSTPTSIKTTHILSNSTLASANWADLKGCSHCAVFYQTPSKSLFLSLWDSQNTTWAERKFSASLNSTFTALRGTPLSCAVSSTARPFQLSLFYLSTSNRILEVYTTDPQGAIWDTGSLTTYNLEAGTGSQLASYWQLCDYVLCSQQIILMYEDTSQKMTVANGSDWADTYQPTGISINSGSGLALIPLAPLYDPNTQPYQLRAYADISDTSEEWMWGFAPDVWIQGGHPTISLSNPSPRFAASSFGTPSQGVYEVVLVFLFANGTISANWFDNTNWHTYITPSPTMQQSN